MTIHAGLHLTLAGGETNSLQPAQPDVPETLEPSQNLEGHFARHAIELLAKLRPVGSLVAPPLSPQSLSLPSNVLARIGHFTFLELDPSHLSHSGDRWLGHVDVILLSGLDTFSLEEISRWQRQLEPRVVITQGHPARLFRAPHRGATAIISPGQPGWIQLETSTESITVSDGSRRLSVGWEFKARQWEAINRAGQAVIEATVKEQGERQRPWAENVVRRTLPFVLRYLDGLDESDGKTPSLQRRQENLIGLIRDMWEPLIHHGEDEEHLRVFREILIQSGALEADGGFA